MNLPDFIIVGETKCGTTSMFNNLVQHPNILPPKGNGDDFITEDGQVLGVKEIRFFDKYYWKGWDWYQNCFSECPKGYITGEATPMYLYRTQAINRIANYMSNCKLIVMLRNPTDRLISHYYHISKISPKWKKRYPTLYQFWNSAQEHDYYIIDKGIYWKSLSHLYEQHKESQIYIIRSEDMFSKPQAIYSSVLSFLEIEDFVLPIVSHSRQTEYQPLDNDSLRSEIDEFYKPHNKKLYGSFQ